MSGSLKIYRHPLSGHAHRIELFASLAGLDYTLVDVDLAAGEQKKEPFLALNPLGQIPVLVDGDVVITDSNAILVYLARVYANEWISTDPVEEARIQRVLTLAAGDVAHGVAAARLITVFNAPLNEAHVKRVAGLALTRIETLLEGNDWLAGDRPTIADVAVYSYLAHAPEGNVSLEEYPNVRGLLSRIEALPGFVGMQKTAVGLAA